MGFIPNKLVGIGCTLEGPSLNRCSIPHRSIGKSDLLHLGSVIEPPCFDGEALRKSPSNLQDQIAFAILEKDNVGRKHIGIKLNGI